MFEHLDTILEGLGLLVVFTAIVLILRALSKDDDERYGPHPD